MHGGLQVSWQENFGIGEYDRRSTGMPGRAMRIIVRRRLSCFEQHPSRPRARCRRRRCQAGLTQDSQGLEGASAIKYYVILFPNVQPASAQKPGGGCINIGPGICARSTLADAHVVDTVPRTGAEAHARQRGVREPPSDGSVVILGNRVPRSEVWERPEAGVDAGEEGGDDDA